MVALQACLRLYATNERIFDWRGLMRLKVKFAHQEIYPAWVRSFVNTNTFDSLMQTGTSVLVAVTQPSSALGLIGSIGAGTVAYVIDNKLWHSIHPRLPKILGLRQEFFDLQQCRDAEDAHTVLCASAAAPPLMSSVRLSGNWSFDGGYVDNAPIPAQSPSQKAATLVLLTRHYPDKPAFFKWEGRSYWQPSRPVPVSTWDCTSNATVNDAFALGYEDAAIAMQAGALHGL